MSVTSSLACRQKCTTRKLYVFCPYVAPLAVILIPQWIKATFQPFDTFLQKDYLSKLAYNSY